MSRRTAEPGYESFSYDPAFGTVGEVNAQIAFGGAILFISLFLFLYVVLRTWTGGRVDNPVDDSLPEPLSGSEHAPLVLDNMRLWTGIAVLLVILAYTAPIGYIALDGVYEGSGGIAMFVDFLWEVLSRWSGI